MGGGILVDGGPSALDTNYQLRIRYLPKDPPRDGYKNKGKLRWRLALGRAVRKKRISGNTGWSLVSWAFRYHQKSFRHTGAQAAIVLY